MRCTALLVTIVLAACSTTELSEPSPGRLLRCAALPTAIDANLQRALDTTIDAAIADGFAGQIAVMRDGAYIYRRTAGYADLAQTIPVSDETLFQVASISKYITAALVLKAAEQGRVALDTPIAQFAPNTQLAARNTTIADLLAHRSGMGSSYAAEAHDDAAQAFAAIDAIPVDPAQAGTFRYSNDGYDILAILMERLYGERYETIVRRELLAPACIEHAAFWGEGRLTDPNYRAQSLTTPPPELQRRNYGMIGSAGFMVTAFDLAAWQHALRSERALNRESLQQLWAPRGEMRLGQATFGGFLIANRQFGRVFSARGAEDWGDNAYLNEYLDCGVTIAIVTNRGPAENSGRPLFRDQLIAAAEAAFAETCRPGGVSAAQGSS